MGRRLCIASSKPILASGFHIERAALVQCELLVCVHKELVKVCFCTNLVRTICTIHLAEEYPGVRVHTKFLIVLHSDGSTYSEMLVFGTSVVSCICAVLFLDARLGGGGAPVSLKFLRASYLYKSILFYFLDVRIYRTISRPRWGKAWSWLHKKWNGMKCEIS